jgi:hypothetical protein
MIISQPHCPTTVRKNAFLMLWVLIFNAFDLTKLSFTVKFVKRDLIEKAFQHSAATYRAHPTCNVVKESIQ